MVQPVDRQVFSFSSFLEECLEGGSRTLLQSFKLEITTSIQCAGKETDALPPSCEGYANTQCIA